MLAVGLADLLTGNTQHAILPSFIGDHLDQQEDLALGVAGSALLYIAHTQL